MGSRRRSEPYTRARATCRKCGSQKHVRERRHIQLCRKCRHSPLKDFLSQEEIKGLELVRSVLGE